MISKLVLAATLLLNAAVVTATPFKNDLLDSRAIGDACNGAAGAGSCKSVPDCKCSIAE